MIFLGTFSLYAAYYFLFPPEGVPAWDGKGILVAFLVHAGPVEWIYYWGHRALHHHYLFTRYHTHHHSSFVTQPITCKCLIFQLTHRIQSMFELNTTLISL